MKTTRHCSRIRETSVLTDIAHGVVCRIQGLRVDGEREKATVGALAPLQVRVDGDKSGADVVSSRRRDARAKGGSGGYRRSGEFDTDGALACRRIISARSPLFSCVAEYGHVGVEDAYVVVSLGSALCP